MSRTFVSFAVTIMVTSCCLFCPAAEPLHTQIDKLLEVGYQGIPAPQSDDAEFFRRLNLDLAGMIPTATETRQFLEDQSAQKRRAAIERLLAGPGYVDRMTDLFHTMLMERRGDNADWEVFLRECFEKNKPWNQIVREILIPNREENSLRGSAFFYTQRLKKVGQNPVDYSGLTRDVGRLFLGVDLQCAECHDHLFIDDYKQLEFQGLFAVYKNLSIRRDKFPAINEKSMTAKLEFISVFGSEKNVTGPRIPFGQEFEIPDIPVTVSSNKKRKPNPNAPPEFSALRLIASELPSAENALFRRNIANRLWFFMMGRGLVEPLDQFHDANQATHPELLDLLADEFAAHNFDIKWMLREIALTSAWQRSSQMPSQEKIPPPKTYQLGNQRRLTANQLFWSTLQATGNLERLKANKEAKSSDSFTKLKTSFTKTFATEPKEAAIHYTPSVKQALFLLNNSDVLNLLKPQQGNLIERLSTMADDKVADEVYLSLFCRLPNQTERQAVLDYLNNNVKTRLDALRQLTWAMLSSIEFCINH